MAEPQMTEIGHLEIATRKYERYIIVLGEDVTDRYRLPDVELAEGQRVVRIPRKVLSDYVEMYRHG